MVLLVKDGHWPSCAIQTNAHKVNEHWKSHSEKVKELDFTGLYLLLGSSSL